MAWVFPASGGFFVSFMSGNSIRLAVDVIERLAFALTAAALIGAFVVGVAATQGEVSPHLAAQHLAAQPHSAVPPLALLPVVFAMGAVNLMFGDGGNVRIGLTYMTGTLVKIG